MRRSRYEWNNVGNGIYWSHDKKLGMIRRHIPEHPKMDEIYDFTLEYARDNYCTSLGTFEKCLSKVEERFGRMDEAMKDYLYHGPYDAGARAGLLIEEPDHYE